MHMLNLVIIECQTVLEPYKVCMNDNKAIEAP